MNFRTIEKQIRRNAGRSAWQKGVKKYALEMLDRLKYDYCGKDIAPHSSASICNRQLLEKAVLNGADDFSQYSWGGCSLISDCDIAKRLCNPSELKKTKNGQLRPNSREEWLDTQARALFQAGELLKDIIFPF